MTRKAPKARTAEELFQRNIGTREQQNLRFPPHQIIGNLYCVGTESLGFQVVTTEGADPHQQRLRTNGPGHSPLAGRPGFLFSAIKILLGSHAHADHMQGDALVKELTGARVMAMEQDVPALGAMTPGNKPHPIDRILHDGEQVTPAAQPSSPSWRLATHEAARRGG